MSLVTNLTTAFTAIGTSIKGVKTTIGTLASLTTSDKTSLVSAVNEVKASVPTSAVPTSRQINGKPLSSDITLAWTDFSGLLPTAALPPLAINETFAPADQTAMLALTAQRGDMAIRIDNGFTYVLSSDSPTTLADWKQISAAGAVSSVAGRTGAVVLVVSDISGAQASSTIGDTTRDFAGDFTAALV